MLQVHGMWQKPPWRWKTLKRGLSYKLSGITRWAQTLFLSLTLRLERGIVYNSFHFAELDGGDVVHWLTRPAVTKCRAKTGWKNTYMASESWRLKAQTRVTAALFFSWSSVLSSSHFCLLVASPLFALCLLASFLFSGQPSDWIRVYPKDSIITLKVPSVPSSFLISSYLPWFQPSFLMGILRQSHTVALAGAQVSLELTVILGPQAC